MTKEEFQTLCRKKTVYLDGATGSNLIRRGMPAGVCPEEWILEHPQIMIQLQKEYIAAGSNIIYAPTFTSNRIKLAEYGLDGQTVEMNKRLVAVSKEAAGGSAYVAADLTMTGRQLAPMGTLDFEELIDVYKEQISACVSAGADLIVVETMMSLQESRAALIAAKEVCDLPVMVTMTFEADGRSLFGTDAKTAAIVLESLGAAAVGANCSTGPDQMAHVIREMAEVTTISLIAKPNAGLPSLDEDGNTVYDMDAETFGREMRQLAQAGASVLGGCCGTAPDYIRELVKNTADCPVAQREKKSLRYLTSERQTLAFGLDDPFIVVGERINPTGKKKLQAQLREGCLDMALTFAEEQEACGAGVLDINMGMSGIDEKAMMLQVMEEVSAVTSLPLSLDSSHVDVLEAALRRYPGRALINSISLERVKFEKLLPIAKKYGAMFILLPLSDEGLPKTIEEKISIIEKIKDRAYELGMTKEDIVVDGLVATVGANPAAALETLETIRYCKKNGLATICGLSNISFGLPERSFVNTAFLTMAIQAGLTMAIANPSQDLLMNCALASDLLLHKEEADIRYIERMNLWKETHPQEKKESVASGAAGAGSGFGSVAAGRKDISGNTGGGNVSGNIGTAGEIVAGGTGSAADGNSRGRTSGMLGKVREAVLKGNKRNIVELTKAAVSEGTEPKQILDEALLPGIGEVGELFDRGKYFLPQLIAGAEAMKLAIEYLEPLLMEKGGGRKLPTIVIATVKGDIHDIGKNLVAMMLKNHGFEVIDLGKDVPKEVIVEEAKKRQASVIALSALMTTTMQEMRNVIQYAKEQGCTAKIIIGGAVITQDYADEIGADGYSRDAAEAVKLTQKILGL